ncbi:MAG TPA: response regulator [Ktedonobacteraceae bacterium]
MDSKHGQARKGAASQKKARRVLGYRLLIIDDDAGVQKMLRILLEYEHFEVVVASDGQAALACLDRTPPDLLLLDLMMPQMDGLTFVAELKRRGLRPSLPVIVLTADIYARPLIERMEVEAWLIKPFHLTDLLKKIKDVLGIDTHEVPAARAQLSEE